MSGWYRHDGDDLVVVLHVQPAARRDAIAGLHGDALKICVRARPHDGAANRAVAQLLARQLGVATSAVQLERGAAGRRKRVRIRGAAAGSTDRLLRHSEQRERH